MKCPVLRGVLISGVNLHYESLFGTLQSVLITEVPLFQGFPLRGIPLSYTRNNVVLQLYLIVISGQ